MPKATHHCIGCKQDYPCHYCHTKSSFICSTLNGDEDANMCDSCLEQFAKEYQEWFEKEGNNVDN